MTSASRYGSTWTVSPTARSPVASEVVLASLPFTAMAVEPPPSRLRAWTAPRERMKRAASSSAIRSPCRAWAVSHPDAAPMPWSTEPPAGTVPPRGPVETTRPSASSTTSG